MTLLIELPGVSGGVVMGTPVTFAELVAAIPGMLPTMRDGLVAILGWAEDCVATDDVELDLAGDEGRGWLAKPAARGGDCAEKEPAELRC